MRDRSPFRKIGQSIDWTKLVVKPLLTLTYCSVIVMNAFDQCLYILRGWSVLSKGVFVGPISVRVLHRHCSLVISDQ